MAKKQYLDKRTFVNGKSSNIGTDNIFDLNEHVEKVITDAGAISTYDPTGTTLTSTTVQDAITEIASEWTTTTINVSDTQLKNDLNSGIQLLAAPGAGKYYVFDEILVEFIGGTTGYTYISPNAYLLVYSDSGAYYVLAYMGTGLTNEVAVSKGAIIPTDIDGGVLPYIYPEVENQALLLSTWTGENWTLGDGTLKIKIKYKIVTFGA